MAFQNVSNVIDLYHKMKIEGEPVMKPDVRINRVNTGFLGG